MLVHEMSGWSSGMTTLKAAITAVHSQMTGVGRSVSVLATVIAAQRKHPPKTATAMSEKILELPVSRSASCAAGSSSQTSPNGATHEPDRNNLRLLSGASHACA